MNIVSESETMVWDDHRRSHPRSIAYPKSHSIIHIIVYTNPSEYLQGDSYRLNFQPVQIIFYENFCNLFFRMEFLGF